MSLPGLRNVDREPHDYAIFIWAATCQNQQSDFAPSEDSDQPGHPPSLIRVFAVRMKKTWVLSYALSAQRRLWSDWAHSHFVCFVMSRLNYLFFKLCLARSFYFVFCDCRYPFGLRKVFIFQKLPSKPEFVYVGLALVVFGRKLDRLWLSPSCTADGHLRVH